MGNAVDRARAVQAETEALKVSAQETTAALQETTAELKNLKGELKWLQLHIKRQPARAAVCRIPCLILCVANVDRMSRLGWSGALTLRPA